MSFIKKLFGYGGKSKEKESDESSNQNSKTNDTSNTTKCKGMAPSYLETTEELLRTEQISLFEDKEIILEKLYPLFCESVKKFKITEFEDDYRPKEACKTGGLEYNNKEITSLIRSSGTEIIKQIGKKLISGDFNLTTISFPIKVMIPLTILQTLGRSFFQIPYYMHLAKDLDAVEKMKYVIVASLSSFHCSSFFLKPMNPILGETYEAMFIDGSKFYLEQTSHHPPVSHYEMYGPENNYYFTGHSTFGSSAGLNSLTVTNKGKRSIQFKDGVKIDFTFCKEVYSNTFWGVLKHESLGEITYKEEKFGMYCKIKLGGVKNQPSDSISGEIMIKDKVVSKVSGSFMSKMEFDGVRYWDIRENYPITLVDFEKNLPSSSLNREDRKLLDDGLIEKGQEAKEVLENIQRNDRKLREKYHPKK